MTSDPKEDASLTKDNWLTCGACVEEYSPEEGHDCPMRVQTPMEKWIQEGLEAVYNGEAR